MSSAGIAATTSRSSAAGVIFTALPRVIVVFVGLASVIPVPTRKSWNDEVPIPKPTNTKKQDTGECFHSPIMNVLALPISSERVLW